MVDILGWLCTILILTGYILNATQNQILAFTIWIIGDIGWILYDYYIDNWSHATLSTLIIVINLYGYYKKRKIAAICK